MNGAPRPVVLKFGGTSLSTPARLARVRRIVVEAAAQGPVAVVVSAVGDTTDHLAALAGVEGSPHPGGATVESEDDVIVDGLLAALGSLARGVLSEAGTWRLDEVLRAGAETLRRDLRRLRAVRCALPGSFGAEERERFGSLRARILTAGEQWSSELVGGLLSEAGVPVSVVPLGAAVRATESVPVARPDGPETRRAVDESVVPILRSGAVAVVPGFAARTGLCRRTTLGRGGSDTTATLLAEALGASRVEIWTDVDGVASADPREVPGTRTLEVLDWRSAADLAAAGARVLCPGCLAPAQRAGIPIHVRSIDRPADRGTRIGVDVEEPGIDGAGPLGVAEIRGVTVATVEASGETGIVGGLARLLAVLDGSGASPLALQVDASSASLVLPASVDVERLFPDVPHRVRVRRDRSLVTVVGVSAVDPVGTVADLRPELVSRDPERRWIAFTVPAERGGEAARRVHAEVLPGRCSAPGPG